MRTLLLIGLGGGIGSILRYLTTVAVNRLGPATFPWGTFTVNIAGSFLVGILIGFFGRQLPVNADLRFLLITGFCGGYTTFSTFTSEHISLLQSGQPLTAFGYMTGSLLAGLLAVWLGLFLGNGCKL
jgi:CrcB protein